MARASSNRRSRRTRSPSSGGKSFNSSTKSTTKSLCSTSDVSLKFGTVKVQPSSRLAAIICRRYLAYIIFPATPRCRQRASWPRPCACAGSKATLVPAQIRHCDRFGLANVTPVNLTGGAGCFDPRGDNRGSRTVESDKFPHFLGSLLFAMNLLWVRAVVSLVLRCGWLDNRVMNCSTGDQDALPFRKGHEGIKRIPPIFWDSGFIRLFRGYASSLANRQRLIAWQSRNKSCRNYEDLL
jgi:hypothetical protein